MYLHQALRYLGGRPLEVCQVLETQTSPHRPVQGVQCQELFMGNCSFDGVSGVTWKCSRSGSLAEAKPGANQREVWWKGTASFACMLPTPAGLGSEWAPLEHGGFVLLEVGSLLLNSFIMFLMGWSSPLHCCCFSDAAKSHNHPMESWEKPRGACCDPDKTCAAERKNPTFSCYGGTKSCPCTPP